MRVQNKSIIVTGAGNGIGEGIAKRLAQEGAQRCRMTSAPQAASVWWQTSDRPQAGKAAFFQADATRICPGPGHGGRGRAPVSASSMWW